MTSSNGWGRLMVLMTLLYNSTALRIGKHHISERMTVEKCYEAVDAVDAENDDRRKQLMRADVRKVVHDGYMCLRSVFMRSRGLNPRYNGMSVEVVSWIMPC